VIDTSWLKALKVGDEVVVESGGAFRRQKIHRVEKVTAAHGGTLVVDGDMFDMSWGRIRGRRGDYFPPTLRKATPEARGAIRRVELLEFIQRKFEGTRADAIPTEALARIEDILRSCSIPPPGSGGGLGGGG
jgi:hypothetical protein